VLLATTVKEERLRFMELIAMKRLDYVLLCPESLRDADRMISDEAVDIIVTDLSFAGGSFADWLTLWPRPFILLCYYGEEARVDELIRDEACSYVMRDSGYRHLGGLPTMIRKVLNIRESLNRQNAHLQITERRYLDLVSSLPDIVYTIDGQGRFLYVNNSIRQLGYEPTELIGKHFSSIVEEEEMPRVSRDAVLETLAGKATGPEGAPKLFDERRSGVRMTRNLRLKLRAKQLPPDATSTGRIDAYGEIACVGYPLPEYAGSEIGTVGVIRDITLRMREENRLRRDLTNRDNQLKEIHFRIKNNLQVVSSLLSLQSGEIADAHSRAVFRNCETQIQSIALIHERLYKAPDLRRIDLPGFLAALVDNLYRIHEFAPDLVTVAVTGEAPPLDIDLAIPLALIVNELTVNAVTHGFPDGHGHIDINLAPAAGQRMRLMVSDDGAGFPAGFDPVRSASAGFQLIQALAAQIGGTMSAESGSGARIAVEFPIPPPPPDAPASA
jgi:PAS domain S-box-containing protein